MSNLSSFFGAKQEFVQDDPMNQVAFGGYTGGYNGYWPAIGLYNHNLQYMGTVHANNEITGSEAFNHGYWTAFAATDFTSSITKATALVTTGIQYPEQGGGSPASMNGPTGHKQFLCPTEVSKGPMMGTNPNRNGHYHACVGATFGLDQHYNLFTRWTSGSPATMLGNKAGFYIRPNNAHSALAAVHDQIADTGSGSQNFDFVTTEAKANRVNLQATGLMSSGTSMRVAVGGVSYNQRSKTLCILERDESNNANTWHPVICKNAPDPVDYIGKENEYQVALTAAVAVSGNRIVGPAANSTGWDVTFSGYFGRAILCDDNTIYYFEEANGASTAVQVVVKWSMNAGNTAFLAQDANSIHANANAWAAYNYSNWDHPAVLFNEYQQSLDGETVMTYCSPYYHHGGFRYLLINLKTGKASKLETAQDTANSWSVCAFGARNFLIKQNSNSNGSGLKQHTLNWESYDRFYGGAGHYTGLENTLLINQVSGGGMTDWPESGAEYGGLIRNVNYDNRAIVLASKNQYNPGASQ